MSIAFQYIDHGVLNRVPLCFYPICHLLKIESTCLLTNMCQLAKLADLSCRCLLFYAGNPGRRLQPDFALRHKTDSSVLRQLRASAPIFRSPLCSPYMVTLKEPIDFFNGAFL